MGAGNTKSSNDDRNQNEDRSVVDEICAVTNMAGTTTTQYPSTHKMFHTKTLKTVEKKKDPYQYILCFRPPGSDPRRDVGALIQMPQGVGNMRLLRSDPFPTTGIEGPGGHKNKPLLAAMIEPTAKGRFLGKTGPHLYGGANYGNDLDESEGHVRPPKDGLVFHLELCTAAHDGTYTTLLGSSGGIEDDVLKSITAPQTTRFENTYVWIDGHTIISHRVAAAAKEGVEFNVFNIKYIMFVDALTGVVSPGGVECLTKTHIPIRAHHGQGTHPGQWRVGGEASFGWGGKCQFCTSTVGSAIKVTKPFDVLCYKPLLPPDLNIQKTPSTLAPPKPLLCFVKSSSPGEHVSLPGAFAGYRVVDAMPFPAIGCRPEAVVDVVVDGGSSSLDLHCVLIQSGIDRHLGTTTQHIMHTQQKDTTPEVYFGRETSKKQSTHYDNTFGLFVCLVVPEREFGSFTNYRGDFDNVLEDYIWVDARTILSHGKAAAVKEGVEFNVFNTKYIMFVDALTGVVSQGGVDCVTNTHIPIRADFGGGIHPGQWRVGGEASFGWGGECHMCTSHQRGDRTILVPFDILCHKPSLPTAVTNHQRS